MSILALTDLCLRGIWVLQPAVWVSNLDTMQILHDRLPASLYGREVMECQKACLTLMCNTAQ